MHQRARLFTIQTLAQARAVASPTRLELLSFLVTLGPCSVGDLARAMNRPADGLYSHIRIFLKHGIAVEVGDRAIAPGSSRKEAVIDASADHYAPDLDPSSPGYARAINLYWSMNAAVLRAAARVVRHAETDPDTQLTGPAKNLLCRMEVGRLTQDQLREVYAHVEAIESILRQGRGAAALTGGDEAHAGTHVYSVTTVVGRVGGRAGGRDVGREGGPTGE